MANLNGASNLIHVSVGLISKAVTKGDNNKIKNINANPTMTKDQKAIDIKSIKDAQHMRQLASFAGGTLISLGLQGANYMISDIGRQNGDSNYQAMIDKGTNIATQVVSIGMSIGIGTKVGMAAGPIGALIGAGIGALASVGGIAFQRAEYNREYQHEMFKLNNNQAYNLSRANFNALSGRVR